MPGSHRQSRSSRREVVSSSDTLAPEAWLRILAEVLLFAGIAISPWLFACADPAYELILAILLVLILALWAGHVALVGRMRLRFDLVTFALSGLVILTAVQLVPLPSGVAAAIAPARVAHHELFLPLVEETIGNETPTPRPTSVTISVDTTETRKFLARSFGVLLLYLVVRNWLARRENLPYLVGVTVINSCLLAFFALLHYLSGDRSTILWVVSASDGAAFGPFVCRNHYPDYVNFGLGLGVAWIVTVLSGDVGGRSGYTAADAATARMGKLIALGFSLLLLAVSIPFSLSRGGTFCTLLAAALAWVLYQRRPRQAGPSAAPGNGTMIAIVGLAGVVLFIGWFGTSALEDRLSTVTSRTVFNTRQQLWEDAWKLVPQSWALGYGAGSFETLEPTVRDANSTGALFYFDSVHNEYLEALLDGGVVRLSLTLVLSTALLWIVGQGYLVRAQRSAGPYLLGLWFGLAALIFHSVVDFGVRMPAVAFVATVAAGYGMAMAVDPSFVPLRQRVRRVRSVDEQSVLAIPDPGPDPDPAAAIHQQIDETRTLQGLLARIVPLAFALGAFLILLEVGNRAQEQGLLDEAEALFSSERPDHMEARAAVFARRAALRPFDAKVLYDAGQAHFDVATYRTWTTAAAVAGAGLGYLAPPPERLPRDLQERYIQPGLKYLQAARQVNPMLFRPHTRLALYADYFTTSEPARVHFERAKKLIPTDPDLWFTAGRIAFKQQDYTNAKADWQRSLLLSPKHQVEILEAFRTQLSPAQLRQELVPPQPRSLWTAMNYLYPNPLEPDDKTERIPYLNAIIELVRGNPVATVADRIICAEALTELDRHEEAENSWADLLALRPTPIEVLERYTVRLEAEERYDELVTVLEELRLRTKSRTDLLTRLEIARRGAALQAEIRKP